MLRFDWNSLRVGDDVVLHDPGDTHLTLVPGVVGMVDSKTRKRGVNRVGIRVGHGPDSQVLWPSHLAVHNNASPDPADPCWRCTALGQVAAGTS